MTSAPEALTFTQAMTPIVRIIVAAAGLFCFLPAYELLIAPGVPVLTLGMIPLWFIALSALAIGLPLLAAAGLGLSRTVVLDPARRRMIVSGAGGFGLRWQRRYDFSALSAPAVRREEDTEGPPYHVVEVRAHGRRRPIEIDRFRDEAEAEACAARVATLVRRTGAR